MLICHALDINMHIGFVFGDDIYDVSEYLMKFTGA